MKPEWSHWSHDQLLALCERSAFPQSLSVLRLTNLRIPERELIQILSALPALEHLQLIDKQQKDGPPSTEFLITDNVLRALTFPASRLIPQRRHFACDSQLQCTSRGGKRPRRVSFASRWSRTAMKHSLVLRGLTSSCRTLRRQQWDPAEQSQETRTQGIVAHRPLWYSPGPACQASVFGVRTQYDGVLGPTSYPTQTVKTNNYRVS